ncbi:Amino acid permease [Geobacillus proteiniphilus]|uniref:Amino acid permease n=1 Tax=Geobacillus proteiniphilus TaxID=860353 RepID=A0A1Q5SU55_9BACL|nr:Amino acid permease [Geobacillus proteiniphilus]
MASLKRLLIGKPMETKQLKHEKLPKWKALAVFFFRCPVIGGLRDGRNFACACFIRDQRLFLLAADRCGDFSIALVSDVVVSANYLRVSVWRRGVCCRPRPFGDENQFSGWGGAHDRFSGVSKVVAQSVQYARSISDDITALSIIFDEKDEQKLRQKWEKFYPDIPLKVIYSPYRAILSPLLEYITKAEKEADRAPVTVLLPQFIVKKWWHTFLHNQTAIILRFFLIMKKDVVIATLPYHLRE